MARPGAPLPASPLPPPPSPLRRRGGGNGRPPWRSNAARSVLWRANAWRPLWRALVWRPLRQFPGRAVASGLAVALGIAVVVGIRLANRAATQSFRQTDRALAGRADLLVRGPAPISASRLAALNALGGEATILPYIHRIAFDPSAQDTLELYGGDLLAQPPPVAVPALTAAASAFAARGGAHPERRAGGDSGTPGPPLISRAKRDAPRRRAGVRARSSSVARGRGPSIAPRTSFAAGDSRGMASAPPLLLAAAYARRHGYRRGQILHLVIGARRLRFRIAALLPAHGLARAQAGHIGVLDIGALARLLAGPHGHEAFDGLAIRLAPGVSTAAVIARLRPLIPADDVIQPPAARERQAGKMLAAFHANLLALSFVSLLVGGFLIYNAMSLAVLRRREAIAVVRALGAQAGAVRRALLAEAALLASAGAVAGLGLGWLFARATVGLLSATVNNLYAVSHPLPPRLTPADIAWALGLAWAVALAAAWGPAREASAIPPAAALRPEEPELAFRARQRRWAALCLGLAAAALAAAWLPAPYGLPINGYLSAMAAVFAAALAAPLLLRFVLPPARRWLLRRRRPRLALAAASLLSAQRRVAVLVAALATAIAMVVGVAAMVGSFRQTVRVWLGETLQAQVYIRPLAWSRRHPAAIAPAMVRRAVQTPGARRAVFYYSAPFLFQDQPVVLATRWSPQEGTRRALLGGLHFLQAPAAGAARRARAANPPGMGRTGPSAAPLPPARPLLLVSEPFARRFQLWRGDRVGLLTPRGPLAARIAGVFYDYSSSQGILRVDAATYRRWFGPPPVTNIALYTAAGVTPARLRRRVAVRLARAGGAFWVHDRASLRRQAIAVFDQTFRITDALELIALIVAILGVANTLWAVALERRRELAVLRFLGATPPQVRGLLLAEAAWIGVFAVFLGAVLGAVLAAILIDVVNVQSFGWTIQVHPPWAYLAAALALLFAATAAAGWPPARWAARADPLRAVAAE